MEGGPTSTGMEGGQTSAGRRANLYWKEGKPLLEGGQTSTGRKANLRRSTDLQEDESYTAEAGLVLKKGWTLPGGGLACGT